MEAGTRKRDLASLNIISMSRSRKKYPIVWFEGRSAKQDKQVNNRSLRRVSKQLVGQNVEPFVTPAKSQKRMGGFVVKGKHYVWGRAKIRVRKKYFRK